MRLIDADSMVIELMDEWRTEVSRYGEWAPHINKKQAIESFMKFIEERSTAYDVDKVVEKLKERASQSCSVLFAAGIEEAISIIKEGEQE